MTLARQIPESSQNSEKLREQADRCRRLAGATYDRQTSKLLGDLADQFQRSADDLAKRRD